MADSFKWMIGLGSDQLGYFISMSNFRVDCIGDLFAEGTCAFLNSLGLIE